MNKSKAKFFCSELQQEEDLNRFFHSFDIFNFDYFKTLSMGEKIKKCRNYLKISQKELAEKIGVSESTISKYECDQNVVLNVELVKKIATEFSIPAVYLLDETWWK